MDFPGVDEKACEVKKPAVKPPLWFRCVIKWAKPRNRRKEEEMNPQDLFMEETVRL